MFAFTSATIPSAASSTDILSGFATPSSAARAFAASSVIAPPEVRGVQPAEHQIRVGDRWFGPLRL